jgi:hypothetical protein
MLINYRAVGRELTAGIAKKPWGILIDGHELTAGIAKKGHGVYLLNKP